MAIDKHLGNTARARGAFAILLQLVEIRRVHNGCIPVALNLGFRKFQPHQFLSALREFLCSFEHGFLISEIPAAGLYGDRLRRNASQAWLSVNLNLA
jgi:hypothetical protein